MGHNLLFRCSKKKIPNFSPGLSNEAEVGGFDFAEVGQLLPIPGARFRVLENREAGIKTVGSIYSSELQQPPWMTRSLDYLNVPSCLEWS